MTVTTISARRPWSVVCLILLGGGQAIPVQISRLPLQGCAFVEHAEIQEHTPLVAELLGYSYNIAQRHAEIAAQP